MIAPATAHRLLFGRHHKDGLVALTSRYAAAGLFCLAVAILSAVVLVLSFVGNPLLAGAAGVVLAATVVTTRVVLPVIDRRRPDAY